MTRYQCLVCGGERTARTPTACDWCIDHYPPNECVGCGRPTTGLLCNTCLAWLTSNYPLDPVAYDYSGYQKRTHCPQGHAYQGDNVYINAAGRPHCIICRPLNNRKKKTR